MMNIVIAGGGTMGETYAEALAGLDGVRTIGVWDPENGRAGKTASLCGAPVYATLEELLAAGADAVCVCLPLELRGKAALRATESGKHVIVEAPAALTAEAVQALAEACRKQGVRLFVTHYARFAAHFIDMKRKLEAGAIGELGVAHINTRLPAAHAEASATGGNPANANVILDVMIHDFDLVRWLLGEVGTVYAMQHSDEGPECAIVTLRLRQGAIVNLQVQRGYPGLPAVTIEFAGKKGVIRYDSRKTNSFVFQRKDRAGEAAPDPVFQKMTLLKAYRTEIAYFLECIAADREPAEVTLEDAGKALEIALAAIKSAEIGEPVHL